MSDVFTEAFSYGLAAALGLLLKFNLVERELQRTGGCQPSLQQRELDGRCSGCWP
jgi:hypothetical protein